MSASRRRGPLPAHVCGLQAVMTSFPWEREELPGGPWPPLSLCPWHCQACRARMAARHEGGMVPSCKAVIASGI
jgi:hypothetical protein